MVAVTERLMGAQAKAIIERSLKQFVAENDVSYRLKSA